MQKYQFDYVVSSSNRQSVRLDCLNAIYNQNNLAFQVASSFAKSIQAWFDPFLLADITANCKPGMTLSGVKSSLAKKHLNLSMRISDKDLTLLMQEESGHYIYSADKINIIYAQMHRMAMMHANAQIHFDVYDDLIEVVLHPLERFFKRYPTLIPYNVRLNTHYFNTTDSQGENLPTHLV